MKFAECRCSECRSDFKIKFYKEQPPWKITCPVCQGTTVSCTYIEQESQ